MGNDGLNDAAAVNMDGALAWSDFGLLVVPVEPGSTEAAVRSLPTDCDRDLVERQWTKNPAYEAGFTVGDSLIVISADSPGALAALEKIEQVHRCAPTLVFETPTGVEHLFWLKAKTSLAALGHILSADPIGLKTGDAIVMLPPHRGKVVALQTASSYSDFPPIGQSFVDAVNLHNARGTPAAVAQVIDLASPATAPTTDGSRSAAGRSKKGGEGGEAGKGGGLAVAPISAAGRDKAGRGGEAGGLPKPVAVGTAFAAFTAFAGQSTRETSADAAATDLPAADAPISPTAPDKGGEAGEGGASVVVSAPLAANTFTTLQAVSSDASTAQASDMPSVQPLGDDEDDVLTPKAVENPVVAALKTNGLYISPLGSGLHELACPWAHEHTDAASAYATYLEPNDRHLTGVFTCPHPHTERHSTKDLLEKLGVHKLEARHKPVIRIVEGELHRVLDVCESELAKHGNYYQAGGMIVSVTTDLSTGDPSIAPTNLQALTRALSEATTFEKFSARNGWVPSDPPTRHTGLLHRQQNFAHLPELVGLARQPYFRDDGVLVTQPGYDKFSKRFGVFDPRQFVMPPHPTKEIALAALAMLEGLLSEFRFAADTDKAAALSAMLTGAVRPSLPHAPGFHGKSSVYGTGKTYMCETIAPFAGPGESLKVSFPPSSEEATKAIMAVLVKKPAVVEFDDMTTDLLPHGIINRMFTAEALTDRILGYSKTATVSTRTLFLSSGNNVGPVRDLLRRVITINLDPRCATPASISYVGNPVDTVRKHRGAYVCAALTIILAWKAAGSPRANVSNIATYGGAWADFCRHPLIWLGLPDPATSLIEQIQHDPDADALGSLLVEWHKLFGSTPTTVRKLIAQTGYSNEDLKDAISEFPVLERGEINPSKMGWVLKRNANRIVGGLKFIAAVADGRKAWAVVAVK